MVSLLLRYEQHTPGEGPQQCHLAPVRLSSLSSPSSTQSAHPQLLPDPPTPPCLST